MSERAGQILDDSGLRKTPVRLSVLNILLDEASEHALSNADFERGLGEVDRITLYRTLRAFEQKGIIHQVMDGTGSPKYALCAPGCSEHAHDDTHAHFHCDQCGRTVCLDDVRTPQVRMPEGYVVQDIQLLLRGLCKECKV